MNDECHHDWRVNLHVVLLSHPPQAQLVCAKCRAIRASGMGRIAVPSDDPSTWEKWRG